MKGKNYHSIWNQFNITAIAFLALLIISLLFFSAVSEGSQSSDNPVQPVDGKPLTSSQLREKEQQLNSLESSLKKKEEKLINWENQLSAQKAGAELTEHYSRIINTLSAQLGESNQPYIDEQTGSIGVVSTYLFDSSESDITAAGADYLKEFVPVWLSILLNEDNRDYIAEIIIEGHGDDQGTYSSNLNLSQRRAREVTLYILSEEMPGFQYKDIAEAYISANGKSFSQPVIIDGIIDKEKSRRVEFKFRLKDEALINDIQRILDERTDQ